jgi:hypothetical protein
MARRQGRLARQDTHSLELSSADSGADKLVCDIPLWHRVDYAAEAWSVRDVDTWAHLSAILDAFVAGLWDGTRLSLSHSFYKELLSPS